MNFAVFRQHSHARKIDGRLVLFVGQLFDRNGFALKSPLTFSSPAGMLTRTIRRHATMCCSKKIWRADPLPHPESSCCVSAVRNHTGCRPSAFPNADRRLRSRPFDLPARGSTDRISGCNRKWSAPTSSSNPLSSTNSPTCTARAATTARFADELRANVFTRSAASEKSANVCAIRGSLLRRRAVSRTPASPRDLRLLRLGVRDRSC